MVLYFWIEESRWIVREGVRPRKFVLLDVLVFFEVAGSGSDSKGSSSSSTGEGSISCMGMEETDCREVSWVSGALPGGAAMVEAGSCCTVRESNLSYGV